jgi:cell wall-associated NlpC family hydrolase
VYIELSQLTSNCPKALKAVNYAYKMLGTPYVWGGASTKGTDCSGLTLQCYRYAGITIPRTSREQNNIGTKVSYSEMKPGDLITWSGAGKGGRVSHVGIYVGDGYMIHAGNSGVCKASVAAYKRHTTLVSIIRVTNY